MIADFHLHSHFSGDSGEDCEKIIKKAMSLGMERLCFTEHQDFDYNYDGLDFTLDDDAYFRTLSKLREKYSGDIKILIGTETGLEPHLSERLREFVSRHDYDFVIGSTHLVRGIDPYYPEYFNGRSDTEAFREYFEYAYESIGVCDDFDVYGHIDYIARYAPEKDKNYSYAAFKDIIDAILTRLISHNKGIELNTGGLARGMKSPNPHPDIIRRYRELGGETITVGSDAHKADDIGCCFEYARELLLDCGFRYYTVFERRKPEFIRL